MTQLVFLAILLHQIENIRLLMAIETLYVGLSCERRYTSLVQHWCLFPGLQACYWTWFHANHLVG